MKYIKTYENVDVFNKYKKYVIVKRTGWPLTEPEYILINVIKHSFFGHEEDGSPLYNARFVKSYQDNKASNMYQYNQAVIYPDDIILYETDDLKDGLNELKIINDTELKTDKYNL